MQNILFFDSDAETRQFTKNCSIPNTKYIYFKDSLTEIPLKKIKPYLNAQIISVFTHSQILSNKQLDLFKNLKFIATRTTGVNHIDLEYCKKRNILVSNVPQYGAITVAEFTFALLLNLVRHIKSANEDMQQNAVHISDYTGIDLADKTIGIIGTGSIGRHMIKLADAFGMEVIAYDMYPQQDLKQYYVKNLTELYKKSDIISLHIPSTPQNFHLLNTQAFQKMKKGVFIINTARGDLIDTEALYQSIINKKVAGAGLDVLENEDFLMHDEVDTFSLQTNNNFLLTSTLNLKLLQLKNVIITPHIAFNSLDAIQRINQTTCQNIRAFLSKKPINLQSAH